MTEEEAAVLVVRKGCVLLRISNLCRSLGLKYSLNATIRLPSFLSHASHPSTRSGGQTTSPQVTRNQGSERYQTQS